MVEGQSGGVVAGNQQVAAHVEFIPVTGYQQRVADVLLHDAFERQGGGTSSVIPRAAHGLTVAELLQSW